MARFEKQLKEHLPEYESAGLLDAAARRRFEVYLDEKKQAFLRADRQRAQSVLYTVATAILALGIILLISYNWDIFSKTTRLAVGSTPLLASGALACWYFLTRERRRVLWRELIPLLNIAGVITSIAVCSQIYHIEGNFSVFMRTVVLLTALLPFIFNSGICAAVGTVLLFLGCTTYATGIDGQINTLVLCVALLLNGAYLVAAFTRPSRRNTPNGIALIVFAIFAPFVVMGAFANWTAPDNMVSAVSNLKMIAFPSLCGTMLSLFLLQPVPGNKACLWAGRIAAAGAYGGLLFFSRDLGFYTRGAQSFNFQHIPVIVIPAFVLMVCVCAAHLWLLWKNWRAKPSDKTMLILATACLFGYAAYLAHYGVFGTYDSLSLILRVLANLLCLACALAFVFIGARSISFATFNTGIVMLAALILLKFLGSEFTLLARAVVFIILGAGMILSNRLLLSARNRKAALP